MTLRNLLVAFVLAACALPATTEARSIPSALFSVRKHALVKNSTFSDMTLFENGVWTFTVGEQTRTGRLTRAEMATIRKDLRTSDWTVEHNKIVCQAIGSTLTEYSVRGRVVFTDVLCNHDRLDTASARHLSEVTQILFAARNPPASVIE